MQFDERKLEIIFFGVVAIIGILFSIRVSQAMLIDDSVDTSVFFNKCGDCVEYMYYDEGRFMYGYEYKYGSWSVQNFYYGDTIQNAKENFLLYTSD